ncbi:1 protease [Chlorella sorokiniana]|uniref:1 protease n=1 Tax=Chlorella sorokiniana TaxID=3076 RepID=A0A2P6TLY6_CHLSO|nr:1 protease [Chlorella sorokiniana]|eukprot:PRW45358.1 1 protease [Chlorella sorokiniana]
MYSREESFWTGRLSKLQLQQPSIPSPASPTSPAARIPAIHAAGPLAVIPAPQQPCAPPTGEAALALAAQVEALKLQVATLRRTNVQLSRELAAAEQGVALPPSSESVPLQYLERLHASYQARLGELQAAHAAALERQQQEHEAALRRQAEQYEREAAVLADAAEDPAREAEVALLRDDCAYLKRKIGELGAEYLQRVEVAAAEARLAAQQQAAAERKRLKAALNKQRQHAVEQAVAVEAAAAAAREAAEDAAALERAHHAAELQRLREQHDTELAAVQAQSSAALAEREREYAAMLEELRSLRLAMSRASTRQEERPAGSWLQGALPVPLQQDGRQQQQGNRTPTAPGQLMEPHSDEEDGRWWEQPRAVPPLPLARQQA